LLCIRTNIPQPLLLLLLLCRNYPSPAIGLLLCCFSLEEGKLKPFGAGLRISRGRRHLSSLGLHEIDRQVYAQPIEECSRHRHVGSRPSDSLMYPRSELRRSPSKPKDTGTESYVCSSTLVDFFNSKHLLDCGLPVHRHLFSWEWFLGHQLVVPLVLAGYL